jgi:hypothetical protein
MGAKTAPSDQERSPDTTGSVNAGQPLGCTDRATLGQSRDDGDLLISRKDIHRSVPSLERTFIDRSLPELGTVTGVRLDGFRPNRYMEIADHHLGSHPEWLI